MKNTVKCMLFIVVSLFSHSCDSDNGSSEERPSGTGNVTEVSGSRELDVTGDDVEILDVESYFSTLSYGATRKIYHIKGQNAVIIIRIDNQSTDFDTSVIVYLFSGDVAEADIQNWINNQYSDALYPDVPEPADAYELLLQSYSIASFEFIGHVIGENGDEYDRYAVQINVDDVTEDGVFELNGFLADATVYVQTKGVNE